jgi:hypothetical protein
MGSTVSHIGIWRAPLAFHFVFLQHFQFWASVPSTAYMGFLPTSVDPQPSPENVLGLLKRHSLGKQGPSSLGPNLRALTITTVPFIFK